MFLEITNKFRFFKTAFDFILTGWGSSLYKKNSSSMITCPDENQKVIKKIVLGGRYIPRENKTPHSLYPLSKKGSIKWTYCLSICAFFYLGIKTDSF